MQFLLKYFYGRRALTNLNALFYWWRDVANRKRSRLARSTPSEHSDTPKIVRQITEQGIIVGASDQFLSEDGQQALAEAAKLVLDASHHHEVRDKIAKGTAQDKKSFLVNLVSSEQEHSPDSPLVRLALDKKLLEIVSGYLGLWPQLFTIGARLNFPTKDQPMESQLWHRDPEDLKLIKVFIYLADVDMSRGPFSYIPKTHPFSDGAGKVPEHKDIKRITDDEMHRTFPADSWLKMHRPGKNHDSCGYHWLSSWRQANKRHSYPDYLDIHFRNSLR